MIGTAALLAFAVAPVHAAGANALSPAEKGLAQCYEPNTATKTCASLATYKRNDDGTWDNTAVVLLDPQKPITLETTTSVTIRDGAVCGSIRKADVLGGHVKVAGQLIPADQSAGALASIAEGMGPMMDREICTAYIETADGLVAKAKIAGMTGALPDQRVKWVLPSDGYSVAPAASPLSK
jgi:hypothetical protein